MSSTVNHTNQTAEESKELLLPEKLNIILYPEESCPLSVSVNTSDIYHIEETYNVLFS